MPIYTLSHVLCLLTFISILTLPNATFAAENSVLSSAPIQKYSSSTLKRWHEILDNQMSETYNSKVANVKIWQEFIHSIQDKPKLRQMMMVNQWFKQFPHKQDNWLYKESDYWASPTEFLTKGGDCEDYAIIKYVTLRKLGFSAQDLKIAIVYDVYSGTDHAFLTVKHEGAEFVLDNREKLVVARYMKNRYKPHYAFNEKDLWLYDSPTMARTIRKNQTGTLPGNR